MKRPYKHLSRKDFITCLSVLMASTALAGCAGLGNYEKGKTKAVATSVVVREAKTGNYEILAAGLRKSPSPDAVLLVSRGASFDDKNGEFRKYKVPSNKLEKLIDDLAGFGGADSGGTELVLPDGTKAGYLVPECVFCYVDYNKKTKQFEINAPKGGSGGTGAAGGGGSGGGGAGGAGGGPGGGAG